MSKAKRYNPSKTDASVIKKGFLLYIFLIPLFLSVIIALFGTNYIAFLLNSIAFLLFYGVIVLSKIGFAQEMDYNKAKLTKAPKIPYKQLSSYLLGISTMFSAYIAGKLGFIDSIIMSIIAIVGYWLYYGFDPQKDKLENFGDISADVVLETLREAQDKISQIKKDIENISDTLLKNKINRALERADIILVAITEKPQDVRKARKFLIVYIDGIANVTSSYNNLDENDITKETRERLLELMEDVEVKFESEFKRLKENSQFDLDVNIDVLKEQIKG
ncbi:hypothetical protein MNB_SV-9-994 [hydrothermal vent metagenome]|uniref:5-bromo-4-chloroindolyl phosphate hydrolysis protein n=1 Tax=hydrothermal vent metagenome TaxID=652676 RepID=A0A1W1BL49_9ZZZZ